MRKVAGISYEPKKLLADAALCIKNGFLMKWPNATVLMCYFHVSVKVDERVKKDFSDENVRKMVKDDFYLLQLATSPEVFQKASKYFIKKYAFNESFVNYFEKEWLRKNPNWFEGAAKLTPSTQCAQESKHGKIKQTFTDNERTSMHEMKEMTFEILHNFSLDLNHQKPYEIKPKLPDKLFEQAYEMIKMKPIIMRDPSDNEDDEETENWWISANKSETLTTRKIKNAKELKWSSFDDYKLKNFAVFHIQVNKEWTVKVLCSCRDFLKNFQCIHSVAMSVNKKFMIVPAEVKQRVREKSQHQIQLPNNRKKPRGRPKKAQPALIIQ